MAHTHSSEIYRKLGKKIDGTTTRAPWNQALYEILKALYTPREAELLVKMPFGISRFEQIELSTKYEQKELHQLLENLCEKGLVFDIWLGDHYRYAISPLVVGIFEMTMMRTRGELRHAEWARLFNDYMHGSDAFYSANFKHGEKISIMRALPHEESIETGSFVEILDYEKATSIIENSKKFAIGVCGLSCTNESIKLGKREQRVLHPETIFERLILASVERGTLQNQLFNDPQKVSHKFLRGFFGGFLRIPPVKQALMGDLLRSRFLSVMKAGAQKKNKKQ